MARDNKNDETKYQSIESEGSPSKCVLCADESGKWNVFKAWLLFVIHFLACILFIIIVILGVDDHTFKTGSPSTLIVQDLYQIHVTGLISVALVIIRLLTCACSALLIWRTIFILLDKELITLKQLAHLVDYQLPFLPRVGSRVQLFWSCWSVAVVVLLWPPNIAAPLANSSVAWIPSTRLSDAPTSLLMGTASQSSDWRAFIEPEMRTRVVVNAALMAVSDPAYAFDSTELPVRRYFSSTQKIAANSTVNITFPYFDVRLRWIDASGDARSKRAGDPEYSDVANLWTGVRDYGSVAVLRNTKWNYTEATPRRAEIFSGTKIVSVQVSNLRIEEPLLNGSAPNINTLCPTTSSIFGQLPNVGQHGKDWFLNGWAGKDCYLIAEATITAGKYIGTNCPVSHTNTIDYLTTCQVKANPKAIKEDWISGFALDFMSETMKNIVMLDVTEPWMHNNLDKYTTGMLTLGYHAAWSSLTDELSNANEPATTRIAESVVLANVNLTRICIWLVMSTTLTLSAMMVAIAQKVEKTKTVRDSTLVALAMDLSEVMHNNDHESKLSDAVSLSKKTHEDERLKWKDDYDNGESHTCRHRVVFAERHVNIPPIS